VFGDRLILKLFRQIEDGINPEGEIGRVLTESTSFSNIPRLAGTIEYSRGRNRSFSLGILQAFVEN
jgi:maltose alpha-D-glucosyltransferase / alpha-amylase